MKVLLIIIVAVVLSSGCSPKADSIRPPLPEEERLRKLLEYKAGVEVYDMFAHAIVTATNKEDIWPVFAGRLDESTIEMLTHDSVSELRRKLDTLQRKTNYHPYTREQLEEAIRRKEVRKVRRLNN